MDTQSVNMNSISTILLVFLAELLVVAYVSGNDCRTSRTVVDSAECIADNSAAGGHIWQHIRGVKARPKRSRNTEG